MSTGNGGFPPIVKCNKAELTIIEENKNREFKGVKNAVSIQAILSQKRNMAVSKNI